MSWGTFGRKCFLLMEIGIGNEGEEVGNQRVL